MARKVVQVRISAEGRDQGKLFELTEMPSAQAEKWAMKAFVALARSGVDLPDGLAESGMAGIAMMGLKGLSGVRFEDLEPLIDEMFECVKFVPDPYAPNVTRKIMMDADIEEIATRFTLRKEIFALHVNFSKPAAPSVSISA